MKIIVKRDDLIFASVYFCTLILCSFMLGQGYRITYFFYVSVITLSVLLVYLDERRIANRSHILFWIGMIMAGSVMAFRAQTGMDDSNYKHFFMLAGDYSLGEYLRFTGMERGYMLYTYILYYLTNGNYDIAQICLTYFSFFIWGKAILRYGQWGSASVMLLLVWTHYYFLIMNAGLIRIFIAIPIIFYSLGYLPERKIKKYILCIVFAALFHISALVMLLLLAFLIEKEWLMKHWMIGIALVVMIVPAAYIIVARYLIPILGFRYEHYAVIGALVISLDNFDVLPVFLLGVMYLPDIPRENKRIYIFGLALCMLSVAFSVFDSVVSLGRLIFYANLGIIIVFAQMKKSQASNLIRACIPYILLIYAFIYMTSAGLGRENHLPNLFPYRTIFGQTF